MRQIEADGWRHVRTTGSHRHFKHSSKPNVVNSSRAFQRRRANWYSKVDIESCGIGEEAMKRKYAVLFEQAENHWAAYVPDLPGCITTGQTLEQTELNIQEAIQGHLQTMRDLGYPIPPATSVAREVEISPAA